jgi:hypothetical protein
MRIAALMFLSSTWVAVTNSCLPVNTTRDERLSALTPLTPLTVSIIKPASSRTVGQGDLVELEFTATNATGDDSVATVLVRKRDDREETILVGGIRLTSKGVHESMDWDTGGFASGRYNVIIRIEAGDETKEEVSTAIITINAPPTLTFNEPFEDTTLAEDDNPDDSDTPKITFRWSAADADGDGKFTLELDPDQDHSNDNEIVLLERDLPADGGLDSFDFKGLDSDGGRVDGGTYFYFARLSDAQNKESFVEGLARITVLESNEESDAVLAVTKPKEDTEFLSTTATFDITYTLNEDRDVLIDLKIDTDDAHTNGNEKTILSQRLVDRSVHEDTFQWTGTLSDGSPAPDGIYRTFILVNRGSGTPGTAQADGLIFRRSEANKPLIGITSPTSDQTMLAGQILTIQWRDDTPGGAPAKVFLFIDDDPNPQEAVETGAPERQVLADRDATLDSVNDSFPLSIPADLAPGTYFIFAYIDRDGAAPFEHSSVAAGRIIIRDPNGN